MQDQHSNSIGHEEDLQLFPPCFQTNGCPLNDIEDLGGQFFNDSRGSSSSSTFDMLFGNHLYTAAEMFHTLQLNDGLTFADSQVFRHEGSGSIAHGQQQHLITPSSSPPRSCPPPPPCSLIPESNVTSLPSVSSSSSSKRKKVGKACESCRRAKVGCGEERPCQRCVKKNIACIDKLPQQLYHLDAHHPYVPIMLDRSAFAPSAEIILNGDNNQNQNHQKRQRLCVPTKCSSCPVKIRPAVSQSSSSRVFNSLTTETHQGVILLSPGIMDADIHQTVLQLTSTKSTSLVGLPPSTAFQQPSTPPCPQLYDVSYALASDHLRSSFTPDTIYLETRNAIASIETKERIVLEMTLDDTTTAVTSHHHRANELYRLYLGSLTSMLFSSSSLSSSAIALWTRNGEFINSNASFFVLFGLCGGSGGGRDICIWKLFDKIQNQHSYWKKLDKCIQLHQSISKATSDASLSPLVDPRYQQTFWLNDLTINDATGRVSSVVCSVSCHCDDFGLPLILCGSFQKV